MGRIDDIGNHGRKAKVMVYVPQALHRAAKQLALDENLPVSDIYARAVEELLASRGVVPKEARSPCALPHARPDQTPDDLLSALREFGMRLDHLRIPVDRGAGPDTAHGARSGSAGAKTAEAMMTLLNLLREAGDVGMASGNLGPSMQQRGIRSGSIEAAKLVLRGAGLVRFEDRRWFIAGN